jgi:hypothetical protein
MEYWSVVFILDLVMHDQNRQRCVGGEVYCQQSSISLGDKKSQQENDLSRCVYEISLGREQGQVFPP